MGSRRVDLSPPVLGTLLVAVALALAGCGGGGSSSDGGSGGGEVSTASITLPGEIDGYSEIVKVSRPRTRR